MRYFEFNEKNSSLLECQANDEQNFHFPSRDARDRQVI